MAETKYVTIPEEPKVNVGTDVFNLVIGFIGAFKLILAAPPFEIEIASSTVDAWTNLIALGFVGYGIYKNTYLGKEARKQKDVLIQAGLKPKE